MKREREKKGAQDLTMILHEIHEREFPDKEKKWLVPKYLHRTMRETRLEILINEKREFIYNRICGEIERDEQ